MEVTKPPIPQFAWNDYVVYHRLNELPKYFAEASLSNSNNSYIVQVFILQP